MPTAVNLDLVEQEAVENGSKVDNRRLIPVEGEHDLVFNFNSEKMSVWKGQRTSDMSMDHEGRRLLRWVLDKIELDDEQREILESQLADASLML